MAKICTIRRKRYRKGRIKIQHYNYTFPGRIHIPTSALIITMFKKPNNVYEWPHKPLYKGHTYRQATKRIQGWRKIGYKLNPLPTFEDNPEWYYKRGFEQKKPAQA